MKPVPTPLPTCAPPKGSCWTTLVVTFTTAGSTFRTASTTGSVAGSYEPALGDGVDRETPAADVPGAAEAIVDGLVLVHAASRIAADAKTASDMMPILRRRRPPRSASACLWPNRDICPSLTLFARLSLVGSLPGMLGTVHENGLNEVLSLCCGREQRPPPARTISDLRRDVRPKGGPTGREWHSPNAGGKKSAGRGRGRKPAKCRHQPGR
jgi:hypothetical protein